MKIVVGSKNQTKIDAIKEGVLLYDDLKGAEVLGIDILSGVSEQPMTLAETMRGSHNRAKRSYKNCDLSVGIESGLMKTPRTDSGYVDVSIVSIYDGKRFYSGFSPCIQLPKRVVDLAINEGIGLSPACKKAGITDKDNIGKQEGFVGLLTGGRINRKEYTKYGFIMAMAYKENHSL